MPLPLLIAGIGASLVGSVLQGIGQKQAADAQADADEENARLAEENALDVVNRGRASAGRYRRKGSQVIAEQKVAFAANGIDASSGSPLALMADARVMSDLDAATVANNAAREAKGYRAQASQLRKHAGQTRTAGNLAMAGSLLGGLGSSAGMAYQAYQ